MKHSQSINPEAHNLESWTRLFWVSGKGEDRELVVDLLEHLLEKDVPGEYQGEPRSLGMAETLRYLEVDQTTLMAALLADPYFTDRFSLDYINEHYGANVAVIIQNMRTLQQFTRCSRYADDGSGKEDQATHGEQLRRMILAIVKDLRVVLIKLAWQLQLLRLLAEDALEDDQYQVSIARQTLEVYAPLASRLGISQLKWEMEDLAFRFQQPDTYKRIAKGLSNRRIEREEYIENFTELVRSMLSEEGVEAKIYGRPKHIYSIYRKMNRKNIELDQLYDLRAIRVIVDTVQTCYKVLSIVHERWPHLLEEYDDYIHNRKANGYQSIHTVVLGPKGRYVEIQIRTDEMHRFAESGVASHWNYKEGGKSQNNQYNQVIDDLRNSLNELLERSGDNTDSLLEDFHKEAFADRVFVMTPKGRVIELMKGATPIDFAYAIHTDIGHRCQGAKINGTIVPLNYELQTGQQVEILTGKEARPKMNWLNPDLGYVRSSRTKQKINHWFRQQNHDKNLADGEEILEREKHLLNLPKLSANDLFKQFNRQSERDFLISLGRGDISHKQLADTLIRSRETEIRFRKVRAAKDNLKVKSGIEVYGVKDLYTQVAQCCQPVHGEPIIGFITQGRGVSVHRKNCPNIVNLNEMQQVRLIEVSWAGDNTAYAVDILVAGYNENGLLRDITNMLFKEHISVLSLNTRPTHNADFVLMDLTIQISHMTQLSDILERLMQIPAVTDAQRRGDQADK